MVETIGFPVTANQSSAGNYLPIDSDTLAGCTVTNSSAYAVEYSTGGAWTTIAAGGSATINTGAIATTSLRFRKKTGDSIPVVLSVAVTHPGTTPAQLAMDAAGNVSGLVGPGGYVVQLKPKAGLTLKAVITKSVFGQFSDGRYLCTDKATGSFAQRLFTADGDITGTTTNVVLSNTDATTLKNAAGTVIGGSNSGIWDAWVLSDDSFIFSVVGHGSYAGKVFLYKASAAGGVGSDAGFSNRQAALDVGMYSGTQTAQIYTLHNRSLCEATVNGSKVLVFCEYNVNASRTPGTNGDQAIAYKSTDMGRTWTELLRFNTDGSTRQISHFHGVKQNPYTGQIYFMTGDVSNERAIIVWDGISAAPAANSSMATIASTTGWGVIYGSELHRIADLLFTPTYAYALLDCDNETADTTSVGYSHMIYDPAMRYASRVAGIARVDAIPPILGVKHSSGVSVWASFRTNIASENMIHFWCSGDDGQSWRLAAKATNYQNSTGMPRGLFEDQRGNIILSGLYGRGLQFTPAVESGTSLVLTPSYVASDSDVNLY